MFLNVKIVIIFSFAFTVFIFSRKVYSSEQWLWKKPAMNNPLYFMLTFAHICWEFLKKNLLMGRYMNISGEHKPLPEHLRWTQTVTRTSQVNTNRYKNISGEHKPLPEHLRWTQTVSWRSQVNTNRSMNISDERNPLQERLRWTQTVTWTSQVNTKHYMNISGEHRPLPEQNMYSSPVLEFGLVLNFFVP
jgi:hypothetical protein